MRKCADGKERPRPIRKSLPQIFELIPSYDPGYIRKMCECEREAMKIAWLQDHPGQYQQDFVCDHSFVKGVGKYDATMPGKKVFPTPFRLSVDELAYLSKCFPDWMFVQTSSAGHDHPVSHCITKIATYEAMKALTSGSKTYPKHYLDLHGNPKSNKRWSGDTKKIHTVVEYASPQDYLRARTKWGPEKDGEKLNYILCAIRDLPDQHTELMSKIEKLISIHTLYYYEEKELVNAINATKGKLLEAIIHRHQGTDGKLNHGELEWVAESGEIKQTNKRTGESYCHPLTEKWFTNTVWTPNTNAEEVLDEEKNPGRADRHDSLTWTINMVCEGTYRITMTTLPNRMALFSSVVAFDGKRAAAPVNSIASIKRTGEVKVKLGDTFQDITIRPEHQAFMDMARVRMNNKRRDKGSYDSHVIWCTIQSKGVMKQNNTEINSEELRNVIVASFWADAAKDATWTPQSASMMEILAKEHRNMLNGQYAPVSGVAATVLNVALDLTTANTTKAMATNVLTRMRNAVQQQG
jgi:hypothetical protein